MKQEQLSEAFKEFENASRFVSQNYEQLQQKYGDRYVAVRDAGIVAVAPTFHELLAMLEKQGLEARDVIIEFFPAKGTIVVY